MATPEDFHEADAQTSIQAQAHESETLPNRTLTFCCARGEFRGPKMAELVLDSEYVYEGYSGLAEWMGRLENEAEKIQALKLFYADAFIIMIVDQADENFPQFKKAIDLMSELFTKAGIADVERTGAQVIDLIVTKQLTALMGTLDSAHAAVSGDQTQLSKD